ncbi:MAG TPA: prephenate dehydrogenase [Candidatus Hydrogenedentes bacterium]|nr:prephenate dehydrogenase [Candidatus Hydrogenedentota bacterium]
MTIGIERVTIIGVGLLGASLGLALKKRALAKHITGVGRRHESLDTALRRGAIDCASLDVREAVSKADMVVISTPAGRVASILDAVLSAAPANAVLFDVASVKKGICDHARARCPKPRRFVGCHPMTGNEKYGPEHGGPDFYEGGVCLIERADDIDAEAREKVRALWRNIGARAVDVDAAAHDAALARTSHAPHVAAAALARIAADFGACGDYVGRGFLDVTRIAAARPELWRDICLENRVDLGEALRELRHYIETFEKMLAGADAAGLAAFFEAGADARRRATS